MYPAVPLARREYQILKREASMAEPTYEELKARLAQLEKEVETKKRSGDLVFKVGEKGGVSVYGLGRFPVTLYYEQWNRLLGAAEEIRKFLEENKSKLKLKEQ
jgi:ribosome-interacting GTPase 1